MKKPGVLIFIAILSLNLHGQQNTVISLELLFLENAMISPFKDQLISGGVFFSGEVEFFSDTGLVRIILMDRENREYLIFESFPLLSGSSHFSVYEEGEETIILNRVNPAHVYIEIVDASLYLEELILSRKENNQEKDVNDFLQQQSRRKIDRLNQHIQERGKIWLAGETSISRMSYMEKKTLFGGNVPNLQGFEYYIGGVFDLPVVSEPEMNTLDDSSVYPARDIYPFPSEFTWQNRHGTNWLTPVKDQGTCGSCWAFGTVAAVELLVNQFFNQHIDYNLSEQYIISCGKGSCEGGCFTEAFDFIKENGIIPEDCFSYAESDVDCKLCCEYPDERIEVEARQSVFGETEMKKAIANGSAVLIIPAWRHVAQVVGYKELLAGDTLFDSRQDSNVEIAINRGSPYAGKTAWLIKNSWGKTWGKSGFGYILGGESTILIYSLNAPVNSLVYSDRDIVCADRDGDGFYFWGTGPKPWHCPECPDVADGDDSDTCISSMNEYGKLISIIPRPDANDTMILSGQAIPDLFVSGNNVRWYTDRHLDHLVSSGNSYNPAHSGRGVYSYYVTQTFSACESAATELKFSIVDGIAAPEGQDNFVAVEEPAILHVEGEPGAEFRWYNDPGLRFLLGTGDRFEVKNAKSGIYSYYVTQTLYQIESPADTITLTVSEHVYIQDSVFLEALTRIGVDADGNQQISFKEAEDLSWLYIHDEGISDLTGIEAFINLETLICKNISIDTLDLSQNKKLKKLSLLELTISSLNLCHNTGLYNLCLEDNILLNTVYIWNSFFDDIDVEINNCPNIEYLNCIKGLNTISSAELSIFPNPAGPFLNILVKYQGRMELEIANLNGLVLYSKEIEAINHRIDLSIFQSGVYFLSIKSTDFVIKRKFVKL